MLIVIRVGLIIKNRCFFVDEKNKNVMRFALTCIGIFMNRWHSRSYRYYNRWFLKPITLETSNICFMLRKVYFLDKQDINVVTDLTTKLGFYLFIAIGCINFFSIVVIFLYQYYL
jgi:hypothetical protein